jgi:hypothetical protein
MIRDASHDYESSELLVIYESIINHKERFGKGRI